MDEATGAPHTPWARSALIGALLSVVVGVVLVAFSWPSVTLEPREVPVVISGPEQAVDQIEAALDERAEGTFALHEVEDRDAAVAAIETREAYGAIVLGASPEVLTSSAAGSATNQMMVQLREQLQQVVQQQAAQAQDPGMQAPGAQGADAQDPDAPTVQGTEPGEAGAAGNPAAGNPAAMQAPAVTVELTDVVPLIEADSRGAGLTAAAMPLVFGGMIGGIAITFAISGAWRRVTALFVYAAAGGLVLAGIMQGWFGVLPGDYFALAAGFGLTLLAMGATIVGFASLLGRPGIAVGPVLFMLIGNPISGATFPKEFYAQPWGSVGQFLPPGAGGTLLKDLAYFPSADLAFPITVLCAWAIGGLALVAAGHFRDQGRLTVQEANEALVD